MSLPVDMPVDSARKLCSLLSIVGSRAEWAEFVVALREACDKAGDGISIKVTYE